MTASLSPASADATVQAVTARILSRDFDRFNDQQAACGYCASPVRLRGQATTVDLKTGEVLSRYTTTSEPDGVTYVRCGNRRAAKCPSCSREYQGDMWHLLAAGSGGGMKGVPESVGYHPQLFVTLTAPSFGAVHTIRNDGRCRPFVKRRGVRQRHDRWLCPHGRAVCCNVRHDDGDDSLGQPLCADCYDYVSHVVWQWHAPELWRRFTIALHRELAARLGVPGSRVREFVQVSFAKVAEFQRRGVVHFHAIVRLDGAPTAEDRFPAPVADIDAAVLSTLVRAAAARVVVDAPPVRAGDRVRRLRFGAQLDVKPVRPAAAEDSDLELSPRRVAAYIAKYATKACEDFGIPSGVTGSATAHRLGVREHICRVIDTAAWIADVAREDDPYDGLVRWLHMLGFRGHFATKSRRYSTTLGRLRGARRRWQVQRLREERNARSGGRSSRPAERFRPEAFADPDHEADDSTLVVGDWSLAGIGWANAADSELAQLAAELLDDWRTERRRVKRTASVSVRRPDSCRSYGMERGRSRGDRREITQ